MPCNKTTQTRYRISYQWNYNINMIHVAQCWDFFWDMLRDLGHPWYYEYAAELYFYFCLIYLDLMMRASRQLRMRNAFNEKQKMLSCQCSHINKEVNNGVWNLFQFWDGAVFFSACSRFFSILLGADLMLIGWKWLLECQCVQFIKLHR